MKSFQRGLVTVFVACLVCASSALAQDRLRIALIDTFSGPGALSGELFLRHYQIAAEEINGRGGILGRKIEIVPMDNKLSAQESLIALRRAQDDDIRYVASGGSSTAVAALSESIAKFNQRNPGHAQVLFNFLAVDPALTNERCNFWHFRFVPDGMMKTRALIAGLAARPSARKIYLVNQDYSWGQMVSRTVKQELTRRRPDITIVGDDLHPIEKVIDFAPYVNKIRASGADTVVTGNWGSDLALLIRAGREMRLDVDYYTFFGAAEGAPRAMGSGSAGRVHLVSEWHSNFENTRTEERVQAYRRRFPDSGDDLVYTSIRLSLEMLAQSAQVSQSIDPLKVARALEGLRIQEDTGEAVMRADNHQIVQPLILSTLVVVDGKTVKHDVERTGRGFRTDRMVDPREFDTPTTCQMVRP